MDNQWILDVLADLQAFAQLNGLDRLAEQLDDTSLVARAELASGTGGKTADDGCLAGVAGPGSGLGGDTF